jgi:hypothetical protein
VCHNDFRSVGIRIGGVHWEAGCERRVDGSNTETRLSLCERTAGGRGEI